MPSQHSQANKDGRRKEKARVRTRFLPSADSISDKTRASHLSISSPALPEVARHHCMSHPIDRSVNLHKLSSYACMCPSSVTMLSDKASQRTSSEADRLKPQFGVDHRILSSDLALWAS